MAKNIFANNASALLAASIDDNDMSIQVAGGYGALFPSPGAGEYFLATLENADGDIEVVRVTGRSTDLLTVSARGQEGTSAQSWTNGATRVEVRLTKGGLENFLQRAGDTLDGDLDFQDNDAIDVNIKGESTMTGGQLVGTAIRGTLDDDSNEIDVPSDGTRATAGGEKILTAGDDVSAQAFKVGMIIEWFGAAVDVPDGWHICDGTGGTPDMRGFFTIGAGGAYALGATGGSATASGNTDAGGAHTHALTVDSHVLTTAEIPDHSHPLLVCTSGSGDTHNFNNDAGIAGDTDPKAYWTKNQSNGGALLMQGAGGGGGHDHTGSAQSGGSHTHALSGIGVLPPYKALYKIMFVGA